MDARALPRRLIRSRWFSLGITGAILIAWGLVLRQQLAELAGYPWQINPLAFGAGVFWGALYFAGLALCWALLLRHMASQSRPPRFAASYVWLASMITRYIPGNIWHILSRVALAGRLQVPGAQVLASATIEQVLTLLGAFSMFAITLPLWGVTPIGRAELLILIPVGLALLHPRIFGRLLGWAAVRLKRPELAWRYSYRQLLGFVLAYAAAMLCAGLGLYVLLWGLTPVAAAQLPLVIGAAALGWAVGYLSIFTPSGLGVREAMLTALLAQLYPLPVAIVASLLHRLALTLGELLAVAIAWVLRRLMGRTADEQQDTIRDELNSQQE